MTNVASALAPGTAPFRRATAEAQVEAKRNTPRINEHRLDGDAAMRKRRRHDRIHPQVKALDSVDL